MIKRLFLDRALVAMLSLVVLTTAWAQDDELLEPDKAFALQQPVVSQDKITLQWKIAPGYYLYQNKFAFELTQGSVQLGKPVMSEAIRKNDEFFGEIPEDYDKGGSKTTAYALKYVTAFFAFLPAGMDFQLAMKRSDIGKAPSCAAGCRVNSALLAEGIVSHLGGRGKLPVVPTTLHLDPFGMKMKTLGPKKRRLARWILGRRTKRNDV